MCTSFKRYYQICHKLPHRYGKIGDITLWWVDKEITETTNWSDGWQDRCSHLGSRHQTRTSRLWLGNRPECCVRPRSEAPRNLGWVGRGSNRAAPTATASALATEVAVCRFWKIEATATAAAWLQRCGLHEEDPKATRRDFEQNYRKGTRWQKH